MIAEDYVSFETAKLLKERGFDEPCECLYDTENNDVSIVNGWMDISNSELEKKEFVCYSAPTLQMAMKWLREVHKLHIILDIHWLYFANQNGWMYTISRILENGNEYIDSKGDENDKNFYSTYEEVAETAILYCLKNLI